MWNLKRLAVGDHREHLDIAFPIGGVPQLLAEDEKVALLNFYDHYEQASGRPSAELVGEATSEGFRRAVHDAYGLVQDGRRLGALRSALKLLAESCPYCGYGPIEELDHHLPRGQFKLFSIFPLNLVPSCGACNRGKGKHAPTHQNEHLVHVYLEDLSGYDFLRTEVNLDPVTGGLRVRYYISESEAMSKELHDRLVNHMTEFDLQTRYEKQVNIFLGEQEYPITSTYQNGGAEALKVFLVESAKALQRRFGVNDWRVALIRGLSECPAFCAGGFETAMGLRPLTTAHPTLL